MKAFGYNKRLPISNTEWLMASEVPTPEVGGRDRRSFLIAVGRTVKALAMAHVLRSGAAILGPGAMLLRADRADTRTREPLIQPSEIHSENGVLKATITAAPGRVQLGDFAFPGFLYNSAYVSPFQDQAWRKPDPAQQLATVVSAGLGTTSAAAETEVLRQRSDGARWIDEVRSTPIARRRTLQYSRTPDRQVFMIDGRVMDDNRIDQTVSLGDTEEWTVVNTDQQYHSFHIHQTAFLVTEVNGVRQHEDSLRDTFWVPPATDDGPSVLKVVIPFTDPVIVGRFVYHCHSVNHEDKGMMGIVEVVA